MNYARLQKDSLLLCVCVHLSTHNLIFIHFVSSLQCVMLFTNKPNRLLIQELRFFELIVTFLEDAQVKKLGLPYLVTIES